MVEKPMTEVRLGSVGLLMVLALYGSDNIRDSGDFFTPGIAFIPTEDLETFYDLEYGEFIRRGMIPTKMRLFV